APNLAAAPLAEQAGQAQQRQRAGGGDFAALNGHHVEARRAAGVAGSALRCGVRVGAGGEHGHDTERNISVVGHARDGAQVNSAVVEPGVSGGAGKEPVVGKAGGGEAGTVQRVLELPPAAAGVGVAVVPAHHHAVVAQRADVELHAGG